MKYKKVKITGSIVCHMLETRTFFVNRKFEFGQTFSDSLNRKYDLRQQIKKFYMDKRRFRRKGKFYVSYTDWGTGEVS